jgi:hypothetical protein
MRRKKSKKTHKYGAKSIGKFRSKLELYCAQQLTDSKIPFDYELHTFELIPSMEYSTDS